MKTIFYTVDIKDLLEVQENETKLVKASKKRETLRGEKNKLELLKFVLPFMHGLYSIHNNKCTITASSVTGYSGFLGLSKINIEEKLDFIINSPSFWKDNFQVFEVYLHNGRTISIWLNSRAGCYMSTPNLPYSMTTATKRETIYGFSIKDELWEIAKYCAKYTDKW